MARTSRRAPQPKVAASSSAALAGTETRLLAAEAPLLLALALAPVVAASQDLRIVSFMDVVPPLWLACLVWLSLLLRLLLPGLPPLRTGRLVWLLVAFPLAAALTVLWTANRGATVFQTLLYASWACTAVLAAEIAARGGTMRLVAALLVGGMIVAGVGLQEYAIQARLGNPGWRAFSRFSNPNFFAGYLAPCLLLTLGLALFRPQAFNPSTWLFVIGAVTAALSAALAVTGSRGGMLSLGAGLFVFALLSLRHRAFRERGALARVGLLLALSAVAFGALSGTLRMRQGSSAAAVAPLPTELCPQQVKSGTADSNEFRRLTWKATAQMGMKRPLLGWGAGSFESAFGPQAIAAFTRHAHQSYLQLFAEEGVFGALLCVAILALALFGFLRKDAEEGAPQAWNWAPAAGAALAATCAHNFFDSILFVPASGLLTFCLLGLGMSRLGLTPETESAPLPSACSGAGGGARVRWVVPALAAMLMVYSALAAVGRGLVSMAREQARMDAAGALEMLGVAQLLVPWDVQVAIAQADTLPYLHGNYKPALYEAARRARRLSPYRGPGYQRLAHLCEFDGDLAGAAAWLTTGLQVLPNEIQLLYQRAQVYEKARDPADALGDYVRIVQVEQSPAGQVRALGEVIDYRFAKAHEAISAAAEGEGKADLAFQHRNAAACLLAQRRRLEDADPSAYLASNQYDRDLDRDLRVEEERLWRRLAQDYGVRKRGSVPPLCLQLADEASRSWEGLDKKVREIQGPDAQ